MIYFFQLTFGYNTRYNNSGRLGKFIVYIAFSHVYFRHQKFLFYTYMVRKVGARKWESYYGAGFWSVCHGYYSKLAGLSITTSGLLRIY